MAVLDLNGDRKDRMRLGYNTNGLAHHRLLDAIDLLADEGYPSVAITLDAGRLDPYEDPALLARQVAAGPRRRSTAAAWPASSRPGRGTCSIPGSSTTRP